jgi:sulfur-oxidizing protein SoxY
MFVLRQCRVAEPMFLSAACDLTCGFARLSSQQPGLKPRDDPGAQLMRQISRRDAIALGAGGAALALAGWPNSALADAKEATDEIAKFTGGKTAEKGKITIELPEIAENGNTVPLSVVVDSPMQGDNYVSDILVVSEGNPRPGVAHFHLTPASGKAAAATRIRLATTQNIVVVAKTSTGQFFTDQKLVKVTIGGCGG